MEELSFFWISLFGALLPEFRSAFLSDEFGRLPSFFFVVPLELFPISRRVLFLLGSIFNELNLIK